MSKMKINLMQKWLWSLIFLSFPLFLGAEEPWSVSANAPAFKKIFKSGHHQSNDNKMLYIYQKFISSFDGPRCQLHPTCSGYAHLCFKKYGPFVGMMMATDRLIHESNKINWLNLSPLKPQVHDWQVGPGRIDWFWASRHFKTPLSFRDSLEANSFWWQP